MPVLLNILRNKQYRPCIMADIGCHYEKIKHWIPDEEKVSFQERMADCIEDETAYCTPNTFLYYDKVDTRMAHGVALFGMKYAEELLGMWMAIFTIDDKNTCMMRFRLHPGKMMSEYKSLLTVISMKRCHQNNDHPLMIRVDEFRKKIYAILDKK